MDSNLKEVDFSEIESQIPDFAAEDLPPIACLGTAYKYFSFKSLKRVRDNYFSGIWCTDKNVVCATRKHTGIQDMALMEKIYSVMSCPGGPMDGDVMVVEWRKYDPHKWEVFSKILPNGGSINTVKVVFSLLRNARALARVEHTFNAEIENVVLLRDGEIYAQDIANEQDLELLPGKYTFYINGHFQNDAKPNDFFKATIFVDRP